MNFAVIGAVHPDIAYAKLRSLAEGARIASERLWAEVSDPRPPVVWTWRLLLKRLRRVARPTLALSALWLAWTLVALALRGEGQGHFIALLLLGLCVLISAALAGLGWYLVTRRLRARDAAELAQDLIWLNQVMQPRRPLPPLGTWEASPDLLVALWRIIREKRPARVLELSQRLFDIGDGSRAGAKSGRRRVGCAGEPSKFCQPDPTSTGRAWTGGPRARAGRAAEAAARRRSAGFLVHAAVPGRAERRGPASRWTGGDWRPQHGAPCAAGAACRDGPHRG